MKSKNKITLFNIGSTAVLQGLAFIAGPIFSTMLGTNNYGIAAVYLAWVQIASTVFSLQAAGTIAQAKIYYPDSVQEEYQSSVLSLASIAYISFSIIVIIVMSLVSHWYEVSLPMVGIGLLHGWGLYCVHAMNLKFTYEFKADKNFILSVAVSVLTIGVSILLITMFPKETNYWGRIIGQSGIYALVGVVLFVYMLRTGRTVYNKDYWKFTLPLAIPIVFHLLAHIVLGQSDKVMLQGMVSNSAAGIYALAGTFGAVLQTLYTAFNNSWVPFYYDYMKNNQIAEMKMHAKNYIELFTVLSIGFILLSREVFHVYANTNYWEGTDLIPFFSIGYYFVFMYSFSVNYEFYYKKTKTIAVGTSGAAIANIVLNYFLINIWGIRGAVFATTIAHGLQFLFHFQCAKRIKPGQFPFKIIDFVPGFCAVCVTCIIYFLTRDYWLVRWGIGAVVGGYMLVKIINRKEIF